MIPFYSDVMANVTPGLKEHCAVKTVYNDTLRALFTWTLNQFSTFTWATYLVLKPIYIALTWFEYPLFSRI